MESYESCRASQCPVNPDPGTPPPLEEDVTLLTDYWPVDELDTEPAIRAECAGIYRVTRTLFLAGSTPLPSTAKDILTMPLSFAGIERALTAERIKVNNITAEAEGLARERHGLQTRVDKSTNDL